MKIKDSILKALSQLSVSELARELICTETNIYYQLRTGQVGPNAIERYAKFLGRNVSEMYESTTPEDHEQPFDEWLTENLSDLPKTCFNVHGKVLIAEAKKLWLEDIS